MSRLRNDDGFSLVEVLIAMTLSLIVLGATLTSLNGYQRRAKVDEKRVDTQQSLRSAMDHMQRQLVNLATPTTAVKSISKAADFDLVFQTADPAKRWVRYCVNPADPLTATGRSHLWYQVSSGNSNTPPAATSCPQTSGWTSSTALGEGIVNARDSLARPVFTFNWPQDPATGADITGDTSKLTRVRTSLWVDTNPAASPVEQPLSSGVFLRNQNQKPVPSFTATDKGQDSQGRHHVLLNASATTDFEGRRLDYHWYFGVSPTVPALCAPSDPANPPADYLGRGPVLDAAIPAAATSPQQVTLCAVDPGDLTATLDQSVPFT